MKYLRSSQKTISASELDEIEQKLNLIFPKEYRFFLLDNNGGLSKSDDKRFDDAVFNVADDYERSLILEIMEYFDAGNDLSMIPIGETLNEDPILLKLPSGGIFIEGEMISKDFNTFLMMLEKQ